MLIVVHAVIQPSNSAAAGRTRPRPARWRANPNLDPGLTLSAVAPGFTLTDQFGQPVSLSSFRGKVVILAFNDAECTTICPLTTAALVDAKDMLGAAASQVQLVGVDANPKATEVEDVLSYSQLHGMTYQWQYLTGSLAQLQSVWKAYSVGVTISQNQTDHEPAIFVINQQGRLAKLYLTQLAYSAVRAARAAPRQRGLQPAAQPSGGALAPVLRHDQRHQPGHRQHPALGRRRVRQPRPRPARPGQPAAVPVLRDLGPGDHDPRRPARHAQRLPVRRGAAGLPGLTAIDEGGVEPSASALPGFLATLRQPLSYPVAIDGSGQVADGYGVQGVPWFVLTSADGKVIWSWEVSISGWPSRASLDQHVRAALASAEKSTDYREDTSQDLLTCHRAGISTAPAAPCAPARRAAGLTAAPGRRVRQRRLNRREVR